MKITLRQLEVFAAIAAHGHVTRAAQAVALTQAAASMALGDLERQLDRRLFDRVGRQLLLNEAGRQLLPQAQEVLDRVRDMEAPAPGPGAFLLHLGASLTIGNHLLPPVLGELLRRYPQSQVDLKLHNTEQVQADLEAFRIDLGFIEGPLGNARLRHFPWRQDRLVVFAPLDHPLAGGTATPGDLARATWVVREKGSGTREIFERALGNLGLTPNLSLELEQPEAIRQAVRAGLGLGCLSALELEDPFRAGWLAPVETPFLKLDRELQIVMHPEKFPGAGIQALLALCGVDLAGMETSI